MPKGYTNVTIKAEVQKDLQAFRALAIGKVGKVLSVSDTVALAIKLAKERLEEGGGGLHEEEGCARVRG